MIKNSLCKAKLRAIEIVYREKTVQSQTRISPNGQKLCQLQAKLSID